MNILITGGAGFIGTALAVKLSKKYNVDVFDLESKINTLNKVENVNYFNVDVSNYNQVETFIEKEYTYIFHLASQTSGLISHEQPELDVDTNVKGTLNICRFGVWFEYLLHRWLSMETQNYLFAKNSNQTPNLITACQNYRLKNTLNYSVTEE